jgi:hypothetical protein
MNLLIMSHSSNLIGENDDGSNYSRTSNLLKIKDGSIIARLAIMHSGCGLLGHDERLNRVAE